jgi:hypothetical protein
MQKTDLIEWSKEGSYRAEIPAPASLDDEDKHDKQDENYQCDGKKKVRDEFPWIKNENRDGPREKPDRTEIGKDEAEEIGGDKHQANQKEIFCVAEVLLCLMRTEFSC